MPLPPWNPTQVLEFAAAASAGNMQSWLDDCGMFCAMAHGFDYSGWVTAAAQGASLSLNGDHTQAKPGDVHFWTEQGSWSAGAGHIAIQAGTPGYIWSNDLDTPGRIGWDAWNRPSTQWGLVYMGWASGTDANTWVNSGGSNPYWNPPATTPAPAPKVDRRKLDEEVL